MQIQAMETTLSMGHLDALSRDTAEIPLWSSEIKSQHCSNQLEIIKRPECLSVSTEWRHLWS